MKVLQLASSHAPVVKLRLYGHSIVTSRNIPQVVSKHRRPLARTILEFLEDARAVGATDVVTSLHVQDAEFCKLLPPAIGHACPNLIKLVLADSTVCWDNIATPLDAGSFNRLQCLELRCVEYSEDPNEQSMQAQLQGLPRLMSLTLAPSGDQTDAAMLEEEEFIINALAPRLKHLCLDLTGGATQYGTFDLAEELSFIDWDQLGVNLQHLQLRGVIADHYTMHKFLNWPHLTRLEVDPRLSRSLRSEHACRWQELTCPSMTVATLAYLPLHPGLLLKVGSSKLEAYLHLSSARLAVAKRAVSNVKKCRGGGIAWGKQGVSVLASQGVDPGRSTQLLVLVLPLVAGVRRLFIDGVQLDWAAIKALCDIFASRADKPCLQLGAACTWAVEDVVCLVAKMPDDSSLVLCINDDDDGNSEARITQLCCAAQRELNLHVICSSPLRDGYMQRIKRAMRACGHQWVTLEVKRSD